MSARADCPIVLPEIQHRRSYLCRFKVHGQPMRQTSELDGSLRASCTHYGLGVTKKSSVGAAISRTRRMLPRRWTVDFASIE